jgi:hypothetical protein
MALGGGKQGHAGIIMEPAEYTLMTGGTTFVNPANPDMYPAGLALNAAAGTRAREEAEHKELINQFETFEGVRQGLKISYWKQSTMNISSKLIMRPCGI